MKTLVRMFCFVSLCVLSVFSTATTAAGFRDYGLPYQASLYSAVVIEIVLLAGLIVAVDRTLTVPKRAIGFLLYLLFVSVSVYGSFVAINALIALPDRRIENAASACAIYRAYEHRLAGAVAERFQGMNKVASTLEELRDAEDQGGYISDRGPGKKQMYHTIGAVLVNVKTARDQFSWPDRLGKLQIGNVSDCGTDWPCCAKVAAMQTRVREQLPGDAFLLASLREAGGLLKRAQYGTTYAFPEPALPYPDEPTVSVPQPYSRRELVDEAWTELRSGSRPETLRAFAASILIDFGLLVLAALHRMLTESRAVVAPHEPRDAFTPIESA